MTTLMKIKAEIKIKDKNVYFNNPMSNFLSEELKDHLNKEKHQTIEPDFYEKFNVCIDIETLTQNGFISI